MRIVCDTGVVLDLMLDREPHAAAAAELMSRVERGAASAYLAASTVAIVATVAQRLVGAPRMRAELRKLMMLFDVAPMNRVVLEGATLAEVEEFDDALVHESALHIGADALVTRRIAEFQDGGIPVYTPDKMIKLLTQHGRPHGGSWA